MLYNVVMVSAMQQGKSAIISHTHPPSPEPPSPPLILPHPRSSQGSRLGSLCYIAHTVISHTVNAYIRWYSRRIPAWQCRRRRRPGFHPWVGKIPWRRQWHTRVCVCVYATSSIYPTAPSPTVSTGPFSTPAPPLPPCK